MKIKNSMKMIALSVVASTLFVGCGSSDDSTSTPMAPTVLTGTFVDTPAQGLGYETATQSGFTDASGHFKYIAGEEVEFKLGNLFLGKGTASGLVTPYTISDNNNTATNIALLLQNFDNNRTDGILNISALKDFNLSDFNISSSAGTIEGQLTTLLATGSFQTIRGGTDFGLLDGATVKAAMDSYLDANAIKYDKKFTQAYLDKNYFYTVDSKGPRIEYFNNGQLYFAGDSYNDDNGVLVVGAGYDGVFNIDGSGVATYTLEDGNIITNFEGDGKLLKISSKIVEITETSITVLGTVTESNIADYPVGMTKTEIWYTDKETAVNANLITN